MTDNPVDPRWLSRTEPRERLGAASGKGVRERDRGRQLPKLLRTSHGPPMRQDAQNGCKRTQSHGSEHTRDQKATGGAETTGQDSKSLEGPRANMRESAGRCVSRFPGSSAETMLRLRAMDLLSEREVRAIIGKFGLTPCLCAVRPGLLACGKHIEMSSGVRVAGRRRA